MLKIKNIVYSILLIVCLSLSTISGVFASWNTSGANDVNIKYTVPILDAPTNFRNDLNTLSGDVPITKIVFDYYTEENMEIIENATGSVSVEKNNLDGIIAYAVPNDSGNTIYVLSPSLMYTGNSCSYMFDKFSSLETIEFNNFDTSNSTTMGGMFRYCSALKNLDLSCFKTNKVTTIYEMFRYCTSLTSIDISHFEFDNVLADNRAVFDGCTALQSIEMPTKKIYFSGTIRFWFRSCEKLTSIDVSCFDVSKVTELNGVFSGCKSLTNIVGLENWDTSKVTAMGSVFYYCSSLKELKIEKWNVSSVNSFSSMFQYCDNLSTLDLSKWTNSEATNISVMFGQCWALTVIDISGFKTNNVTAMQNMFTFCSKLTTIYVGSGWSTEAVESSYNMFTNCTKLVGGNGTTFNSSYIDATYARVDTAETPGYLTLKD